MASEKDRRALARREQANGAGPGQAAARSRAAKALARLAAADAEAVAAARIEEFTAELAAARGDLRNLRAEHRASPVTRGRLDVEVERQGAARAIAAAVAAFGSPRAAATGLGLTLGQVREHLVSGADAEGEAPADFGAGG